jgi:hypothetical protein
MENRHGFKRSKIVCGRVLGMNLRLSIATGLDAERKQCYCVTDGRIVISSHPTAAEASKARAKLIKEHTKRARTSGLPS